MHAFEVQETIRCFPITPFRNILTTKQSKSSQKVTTNQGSMRSATMICNIISNLRFTGPNNDRVNALQLHKRSTIVIVHVTFRFIFFCEGRRMHSFSHLNSKERKQFAMLFSVFVFHFRFF